MKNLSSILKSIFFIFLALIAFLSLFSYSPKDIILISFPAQEHIKNLIGIAGAYFAFGLFFLLGRAAYFIPFYLFFLGVGQLGVLRFFGIGSSRFIRAISLVLLAVFLSGFIAIFFTAPADIFYNAGIVGFYFGIEIKKYLGIHGAIITLFLVTMITALLLFGYFFVDMFRFIFSGVTHLADMFRAWRDRKQDEQEQNDKITDNRGTKLKEKIKINPAFKQKTIVIAEESSIKKEIKPEIKVYAPKVEKLKDVSPLPIPAKIIDKEAAQKKMEELEKQAVKPYDSANYQLPPIDLLKIPPHENYDTTKEDIEVNIKDLEQTLGEFGVEAKVVSVQRGPVVTMYEMEPNAGVKIQKIAALADDIALSMKSANVRVVAPIPGRGTVGIEVPNLKTMTVSLREVLEEKAFSAAASKLTFVIGKDVSGNPITADLADMPHLLIAGATGSGKTVCVNALISSILFKSRPDEVKFIMVDPKMVEMTQYAGIPHLIHPVITDAKKAFVALNWAVEEMERRYRVLAQEGMRNIGMYNKAKPENKLPYIVIIVDELADLMLVARESVETAIQRLAQLARAIGIHLVLATQRPSVDVITGIIKANFPARISFKVSSKIDSRTVLDMSGADKLLGKGDLLFLKPGAVKLIRSQGCLVDDEDMAKVTDFIRRQAAPVYEQGITESAKRQERDLGSDELLDEAVKVVLQTRQASASIIQRRMRVGYTRAARLLDLMEQQGIVGPFCGSKAREIMISLEEYLAEKEAENQNS